VGGGRGRSQLARAQAWPEVEAHALAFVRATFPGLLTLVGEPTLRATLGDAVFTALSTYGPASPVCGRDDAMYMD
jgi:hypothetical protein